MFAMPAHLPGIFTYIIGSLIIWLIKRDSSEFVDRHGREAVNWQISVLVYLVVSGILMTVGVGFFLFWLVLLANIVLCIIAAAKANSGQPWRSPPAIRILRQG